MLSKYTLSAASIRRIGRSLGMSRYPWITDEMFDRKLEEIINREGATNFIDEMYADLQGRTEYKIEDFYSIAEQEGAQGLMDIQEAYNSLSNMLGLQVEDELAEEKGEHDYEMREMDRDW